jgi:hypothetical protein
MSALGHFLPIYDVRGYVGFAPNFGSLTDCAKST